jgi:hypothetical protein
MQNSNHWFVVYDRGTEFRMSRWNARTRLRPDARHLCGQTCLHKLVDEFMARTLSERSPSAAAVTSNAQTKSLPIVVDRTDRCLTTTAAMIPARPAPVPAPVLDTYIDEYESSARVITPIESVHTPSADPAAPLSGYNSSTRRSEAWQREREREQRTALHPSPSHRRSIA